MYHRCGESWQGCWKGQGQGRGSLCAGSAQRMLQGRFRHPRHFCPRLVRARTGLMGWRGTQEGFKNKELGFSPGLHQPLNMPPPLLVREIAEAQAQHDFPRQLWTSDHSF